jgi:hypothetical protein
MHAIFLPFACANGHKYLAVMQVRIMKKRLVRKTFDMIEEISKRENKEVRLNSTIENKHTSFWCIRCCCTNGRCQGDLLISFSSTWAYAVFSSLCW